MNDLAALESAELLARYRAGDDDAATEMFSRYVERLTALARSRLTPRLAARTDPEDIVLSAWRSFFVGARDGRFALDGGGELWPLLVTITLRKLYRHVKHHTAARRSVAAEQRLDEQDGHSRHSLPDAFADAGQPRPEHAAALADELEAVLRSLPPFERRVLELCLQGEPPAAIAAEIGRPERTVRRSYAALRAMLIQRLETLPDVRAGMEMAGVDGSCPHPRRKPEVSRPRRPQTRPQRQNIEPDDSPPPHAPLAYADYLLQRQIGAGRMGKVYEALDRRRGGLVAVKFLKKSFLAQPQAVRRFAVEARTVAALRHPGIVGIHGLGRTPHGGYFIVMELLAGGDLACAIARGRIAIADAVRWTLEAALAIEHAHAQGIVHCDLKPSNLLLDAAGRVRVTDFGLARSLQDAARPLAEIAGTAPFMAPEQVADHWGPISARTDVYGLGAVLYALLTGRPPVDGERMADILSQVVSTRPVRSPRAIRRGIPPTISDICRRCLAKRPEDRYPSARDLAAALQSVAPQ